MATDYRISENLKEFPFEKSWPLCFLVGEVLNYILQKAYWTFDPLKSIFKVVLFYKMIHFILMKYIYIVQAGLEVAI